jgi:hypothetical protein
MAQVQNDSTNFNETMAAAATQVYNQLPEEEKKGPFGQALNYIISLGWIGGGLWAKRSPSDSFRKGKEALDGMLRIIDAGEDKQRFHDALQHHQDNATAIGNIEYENYFGCPAQRMNDKITQCQDTLCLETNFKEAIRATQQKMADKVIRTSSMMSSVIIVLQFVKLYFVWKEISVAKNLHNDSRKFQQIEENIAMLRTIVEQLTQAMQANNMTQVSRISTRAHTKYNQTKSLISNLHVKINGSLQRLDISADGQVLDGISNFATGVGNAVQLHGLFQHASTSATLFAAGIIAAFASLAVANVATYCITQKGLNELRQDMNYLDSLNQQLDQLYQAIEEVENSI